MQHPAVAALGFFRSFLLLPDCSMLSRLGTGGSHPPLLPSVGFAIPPGSSMDRHTPQDTSLEQNAQGRAAAVTVFVSHCLSHSNIILSLPKCREKSWHLVTGPCLPPAPHPLLTPESRAGNTPSPSSAQVGVSVPRHSPSTCRALPSPHPQTSASKGPAGTKGFLHPPFYQELGAGLLIMRPWKVEG